MTRVGRSLRLWLVWVLEALLRWVRVDPPVVVTLPDPSGDAVHAVACDCVREQAASPHTGHYKRAKALQALRRQCPGLTGRDASWALERAVREVLR